MIFWPINLHSLRTWFEFSANQFSALGAWVVHAHIAISRRRIPSLADALTAFTLPLCLLFGNSFVGTGPAWPEGWTLESLRAFQGSGVADAAAAFLSSLKSEVVCASVVVR